MRRQNICYGYKERWHRDHKCESPQVHVLEGLMSFDDLEENAEYSLESDNEDSSDEKGEETHAITLQAMCSIPELSIVKVQ